MRKENLDITITITGSRAVGKTTLTNLLADILSNSGATVEIRNRFISREQFQHLYKPNTLRLSNIDFQKWTIVIEDVENTDVR